MQNANALGRFAMFSPVRPTRTRPISIESGAVTSIPCSDPYRQSVTYSVRCRWRVADDGKLRMEWQSTAES
jgi:hypothetical protein